MADVVERIGKLPRVLQEMVSRIIAATDTTPTLAYLGRELVRGAAHISQIRLPEDIIDRLTRMVSGLSATQAYGFLVTPSNRLRLVSARPQECTMRSVRLARDFTVASTRVRDLSPSAFKKAMRRLDIRRIYPVADMERPAIFGVLGVQKLNPALPEPLADLAAHVLASAAGNTMAILARMRDHLTGLPTRGLFENRLALLLHEAIAGRALSVLMIDIDRFKATNDTYGHLVGDKVLKTVAATIQRNVRRIEDTCRYGGEEIVVVLQEPIEVAQKVAERIRGEVAKLRVPPVRRITVSIGVAQWRAGMTARDVLAEADANLYRAKEGGRNRVVVSTKKGGTK